MTLSYICGMSIESFTLIAFTGAILAGLIGSLTGLGGGIIIIPLLTLGLGVDLHYAIGASLISVIATSSGSASAFVKNGIANIRIGAFLEVATTIGAIIGAIVAVSIGKDFIGVIFGLILIFSAVFSLKNKKDRVTDNTDKWAEKLKLNNSYPVKNGLQKYSVNNAFAGFGMMGVAGFFSGLLGIGSGVLKVLAMDNIMKMPFKVSTTTSNFMIGVTAVASAVVYFQQGYILPEIAGPVMLGVLLGSMMGAKFLMKANTVWLKWIFSLVVMIIAIQMIYRGLTGQM